MATQLGYSDFSSDENLSNSGNNNNNGKGRNSKEGFIARKRRTIKRREGFNNEDKKESPSKLTKAALLTAVDDDDEQEGLADFTSDFSPPPRSELTQQRQNEEEDQNLGSEPPKQTEGDSSLNTETYEGMSGGYAENYVNQFVPYYQNAANVATGNNNNSNSEIAEKLNYLINLIEEQKDEKVGHVAEELILYSFLGVFVIYIVDSFARVGKYVR